MKNETEKWHAYMVRCSDETLYTGMAKDISKRLQTHNRGAGAKYTRARLPVRLVYLEEFPSRSAAAGREYRIKRMTKDAKEELVLKQLNMRNPSLGPD